MTEIQVNAMLATLQRQRDAALNEVVVLRGELAELQAQIAQLSERPADSKAEAEGP
jgi:hypothetical protein